MPLGERANDSMSVHTWRRSAHCTPLAKGAWIPWYRGIEYVNIDLEDFMITRVRELFRRFYKIVSSESNLFRLTRQVVGLG